VSTASVLTRRYLLLLCVALWAGALACAVPGIDLLGPTPTPGPFPTPTPSGDFLQINVPRYSVVLQPGERVPATQLVYEGPNGSAYNFLINGLRATKREGNSLIWSGVIAAGVTGRYTLITTPQPGDAVLVSGSVLLTILTPSPVPFADDTPPENALYFGEVEANYRVPVDAQVPGTTLVYQGPTASRTEASFTGTNSTVYPFYSAGDILTWRGRLRSNVSVNYNFRIVEFEAGGVELAGSAELWIGSTQ
jgi:hypothetical protein